MAAAAGELQRESPGTASERSQRALERLRAASRGGEGAQPDERRRIAGDLQSEARQLADATRRPGGPGGGGRKGGRQGRRRAAGGATAATGGACRRTGARHAHAGGTGERTRRRHATARARARRRPRPRPSAGGTRPGGRAQSASVCGRARRRPDRRRTAAGNPAEAGRQLAASSRGVTQPLDRLADSLGQATGQDAESQEALRRARPGPPASRRDGECRPRQVRRGTPGSGAPVRERPWRAGPGAERRAQRGARFARRAGGRG